MPVPAFSSLSNSRNGGSSCKNRARASDTVCPLHVIGYRCSNGCTMWSCQANTTCVPKTWSRYSSILWPGTIFPQTPLMGMGAPRWLDFMVWWTRTPLQESPPCSPGWRGEMGRRSWHPSATAHFATTWCKTTLQSTIMSRHICVCPCSALLMGVSTLNMAATTCGVTLPESTIYPLGMRRYHHWKSLKPRSESLIEHRCHSAS